MAERRTLNSSRRVCRPVESGPFRPLVSTDTEAAPALSQAGEQSKGSCCSWNTTGNLSVEKDLLVALLPPDSSPSVNYSETSRPLHLPPLSSLSREESTASADLSALWSLPLYLPNYFLFWWHLPSEEVGGFLCNRPIYINGLNSVRQS